MQNVQLISGERKALEQVLKRTTIWKQIVNVIQRERVSHYSDVLLISFVVPLKKYGFGT